MSPDQQTCCEAVTEFLLLPDGRILVHNLSPTMAAILSELCPDDEALVARAHCAEHTGASVSFPSPHPMGRGQGEGFSLFSSTPSLRNNPPSTDF